VVTKPLLGYAVFSIMLAEDSLVDVVPVVVVKVPCKLVFKLVKQVAPDGLLLLAVAIHI
jgi:hypothetical protein